MKNYPPVPFNPTFNITHRIAAALTQIERARGFLDAATLSKDWLKAMSRQAFLLEAHHTTHIEGTRLTLDQSTRLLDGQAVAETDAEDVRELLNYRDAFSLVSDYLNDGGPVTEALVREIHKRLVNGVRGGSAKPGEYRLVQNFVANAATGKIIYTPPATLCGAGKNGGIGCVVERGKRSPPRLGQRCGAVSTCAYTPLRGRKRTNLAPAVNVDALPFRLRFQTPVHHQRILRPRPSCFLQGHTIRPRE